MTLMMMMLLTRKVPHEYTRPSDVRAAEMESPAAICITACPVSGPSTGATVNSGAS